MSATDLQIHGPQDLFNANKMTITGNELEKASAPDLKKSFNAATYGSTPLDARMAQNMGMQLSINPREPIEITPDQKQAMAVVIDQQELNSRAQLSGMSLQDTKMGPQKDSIFSVACNTVSSEIRGISEALNPQQPQMDPRMLQMQQQFRPGSMF